MTDKHKADTKDEREEINLRLEDLEPEEEATKDVRGGQGFALISKGT